MINLETCWMQIQCDTQQLLAIRLRAVMAITIKWHLVIVVSRSSAIVSCIFSCSMAFVLQRPLPGSNDLLGMAFCMSCVGSCFVVGAGLRVCAFGT